MRSLGFLSKGLKRTNICYVSSVFLLLSEVIWLWNDLLANVLRSALLFSSENQSFFFVQCCFFYPFFAWKWYTCEFSKKRSWLKTHFFRHLQSNKEKKCRCLWTTAMANIFFVKKTLVTNVELTSSILSRCKANFFSSKLSFRSRFSVRVKKIKKLPRKNMTAKILKIIIVFIEIWNI